MRHHISQVQNQVHWGAGQNALALHIQLHTSYASSTFLKSVVGAEAPCCLVNTSW